MQPKILRKGTYGGGQTKNLGDARYHLHQASFNFIDYVNLISFTLVIRNDV